MPVWHFFNLLSSFFGKNEKKSEDDFFILKRYGNI
ncbi:Hypothetical Protein SLY_0408 [Strawberry lethal yellows phytoplasma (CPA) str. NZSb11]|uniref:Uncharacterized protein n=1 Tax=Strawberry lethal yellows phytoplasma (CPA) str. NZSb11 TaxID=980422 RepID=R4S0P2_PHYAS|nr:Hypothetical Protein SLY_0408 [Strawberry lethal yellows phytoplasma (CPA) str. NZSb11]